MWSIVIDGNKVHGAYTKHQFKMVSISKKSGHDIFKEMWTQQHAVNFEKFSLVAEKQEVALMTDKW